MRGWGTAVCDKRNKKIKVRGRRGLDTYRTAKHPFLIKTEIALEGED